VLGEVSQGRLAAEAGGRVEHGREAAHPCLDPGTQPPGFENSSVRRGEALARKRVLIVDDEASPRAVIREVLLRSGYESAEARDGLEGLAKAEAVRPDVILLEGRMRGLDGYEVCRRLKANTQTQHIPVIFVTGVEDDELYALAHEVGAVASITKPFHFETLVTVIKAALTNAEPPAEPTARSEGMKADPC
jgi:DNA-binding response OmpR family regulator